MDKNDIYESMTPTDRFCGTPFLLLPFGRCSTTDSWYAEPVVDCIIVVVIFHTNRSSRQT